MVQLRKLAFLVVPLTLGLAILALPGRAQPTPSARFAFADTTLLRDTLSLKFDGLFPLADSLHIRADTLRALSIRYRMPLDRLVFLADSLRMPVDSVGVVMQRERYNPLGSAAPRTTVFGYSSTFSVARRSTTWGNSSNYNFVAGPIFILNVTDVSITRTRDGDLTERFKTRSSSTEAGWKFSPNFSLGGRVNLQGSESFKPGSIYNNSESTNQFDFSIRTRQQPTPTLRSELNLFGGPFDEPNSIPVKRGVGGVLSGHLLFTHGKWLTHDLSLQASGRFGRAQIPDRPWLNTQDVSHDLRGTLNLFAASPAKLKVEFRLQRSGRERPDTVTIVGAAGPTVVDLIQQQPTTTHSLDVGMRLEPSGDDYLNVSGRISSTENQIVVSRDNRFAYDLSTSGDRSIDLDGRYAIRGWSLEARFSNGFPSTEQPRRSGPDSARVYYRERQDTHGRSIDATLSKNLTRRLVFRASGGVNLSSYTDIALGVSTRTRDDYRQYYRVEGIYTPSSRMSSTGKLEVNRALAINIQSTSSAANREDRSYRAEWNWTYLLIPGLTANQRNQLTAIYTYNPFAPDRNRLALDYLTGTTLNAVVTPRLTISITHNARVQPSGEYTRAADGLDYFSRSDRNQDYTLSGSISYAPNPIMTFQLQPFYQASDREASVDGLDVPSSKNRSLNVSGGTSVNLPVSAKGRLTGSLSRNFSSSRSTRYTNGQPQIDPRFQYDYWNGSLQLSWQL